MGVLILRKVPLAFKTFIMPLDVFVARVEDKKKKMKAKYLCDVLRDENNILHGNTTHKKKLKT